MKAEGVEDLRMSKTLLQKLVAIMSAVDHVEKAGRNQMQNYNYVKATDVARAVRNACIEQGVFIATSAKTVRTWEGTTNKGGVMNYCTVEMQFTFHDADTGDRLGPFFAEGSGSDTGDKATFKAQTGAIKYALRNAFLIPDETDPENDAAEAKKSRREAATAPAASTDYKTIEATLQDKKTDEKGYWFKLSDGSTVFKDESSPVDATPLYEAALGCKFRLRVIERKTGSKIVYELAEVLGEPTPPEAPKSNPEPPKPTPEAKAKAAVKTITEKQRVRMMAISKEHGWEYDEVKALLRKHGFEHSNEVSWQKYDEICKELESRA